MLYKFLSGSPVSINHLYATVLYAQFFLLFVYLLLAQKVI